MKKAKKLTFRKSSKMKAIKRLLTISGALLILVLFILSCRTAKVVAVSCPELPVNKSCKIAAGHKMNAHRAFTGNYKVRIRKQPANRLTDLSKKNHGKESIVLKNSPVLKNTIVPDIEYINNLSKIEYLKGLTSSVDRAIIPLGRNNSIALSLNRGNMIEQSGKINTIQPSVCDTIVLKSGSIMVVKVTEIVQNEIRYRFCNNLNGTVSSISKSQVTVIKYPNGTRDNFISDNTTAFIDYHGRKETESFGIAGFIISMVGLLLMITGFGEILGPLGIIFGGISLGRIKRNPGKYKGKGLAKASIIVGIIDILVFIGLVIWMLSSSYHSM
jgi:hypothetical protein